MSWIQLRDVDTTNLSPRNIFGVCFAICYSVAMYTICNFMLIWHLFFTKKMSTLVNDTCKFCPFGSELCLSGCQLPLGNLVDFLKVLPSLFSQLLRLVFRLNQILRTKDRPSTTNRRRCICLDLDPHRIQSVWKYSN
jgi:hypothetical protein